MVRWMSVMAVPTKPSSRKAKGSVRCFFTGAAAVVTSLSPDDIRRINLSIC